MGQVRLIVGVLLWCGGSFFYVPFGFASLATEFEVFRGLRLVSNIGLERNTDRKSNTHPAFVIGGIIYSIHSQIDLNFGVQFGVSKTETDYTIHPGIVYRFNFQ